MTPDDTEEDPEQQMSSIKMEFYSEELYSPSIGAITQNYT
jgi:hypothetical protein